MKNYLKAVEAWQVCWTNEPDVPTHGILIGPDTLTEWAGRGLTRAEVERLAEAIPHSSVPDAIGVILEGLSGGVEGL